MRNDMYMQTLFNWAETVWYSSFFPPPVGCTHSRLISFYLECSSNSFQPPWRYQSKGVPQNILWAIYMKVILWFCMGSGLIAHARIFLSSCVVLSGKCLLLLEVSLGLGSRRDMGSYFFALTLNKIGLENKLWRVQKKVVKISQPYLH